MEFSISDIGVARQPTDCIVVGVFEGQKLSKSASALDKAANGFLRDVLAHGDLDGKPGTTLLLHKVPGTKARRVLLVGLGKSGSLDESTLQRCLAAAMAQLLRTGAKTAALCVAELPVAKRDPASIVGQTAIAVQDALYRFDRLKSKPENGNRSLSGVVLCVSRGERNAAEVALAQGLSISAGVDLARDLGNLPGNICTPTYLAEQASELAKEFGLAVDVLERADMESLGMGSFLSVAKGSHQAPKLIVLHHRGGGAKSKPIVLVGKGITFDSGGISLKPGAEMDEMKFDMCGAASVFGTVKAAAMLNLPINVIGIVPAAENLPGGGASKPGDVVTSMAGKTIEILNTDAEGRLILCDALSYASRFDPECVVDIATLTGACVIALGHVVSGLFANDDALAQELLDAGLRAQDRAWQLPLLPEYRDQLKSNFADLANIGGRAGGAITAASFLAHFTEKFRWAHLDIAGTAWKSGKEKGSTGRPVPLLTRFLIDRASSHHRRRGRK